MYLEMQLNVIPFKISFGGFSKLLKKSKGPIAKIFLKKKKNKVGDLPHQISLILKLDRKVLGTGVDK